MYSRFLCHDLRPLNSQGYPIGISFSRGLFSGAMLVSQVCDASRMWFHLDHAKYQPISTCFLEWKSHDKNSLTWLDVVDPVFNPVNYHSNGHSTIRKCIFTMYFPLENVESHCYVSFLEGNSLKSIRGNSWLHVGKLETIDDYSHSNRVH